MVCSPAAHPLVAQTEAYVRERTAGEATGHDWWHTDRVRGLALRIGRSEHADLLVTELAALLHDIHDWKFAGGDTGAGAEQARIWLESIGTPAVVTDAVSGIVRHISFKGAGVADQPLLLEGQVVRDADRLDALGAIGIARTFAYGGAAGRPLYDPGYVPEQHASADAYLKAAGGSRSHFDEKLLLLKDRMHTAAGRALAGKRHAFMVSYLQQFDAEWSGADA